LAHLLEFSELNQQLRMVRVQKIPEHMQFNPIMLGSQLRSGNELDAMLPAGQSHPFASFHRVVIGQRRGFKTATGKVACEFFRRIGAVGKVRMEMEVGKHQEIG
jgi:hypothetical protein